MDVALNQAAWCCHACAVPPGLQQKEMLLLDSFSTWRPFGVGSGLP